MNLYLPEVNLKSHKISWVEKTKQNNCICGFACMEEIRFMDAHKGTVTDPKMLIQAMLWFFLVVKTSRW